MKQCWFLFRENMQRRERNDITKEEIIVKDDGYSSDFGGYSLGYRPNWNVWKRTVRFLWLAEFTTPFFLYQQILWNPLSTSLHLASVLASSACHVFLCIHV